MKICRRWIVAMLSAILIVTTMIPITASAKQEDFKNRVVGYFPSYRYSTFNSVDFSAMTHCILSFLTYSNGTLTCGFSDAQIRAIKEKCDANDVKLMVALGGWDGFSYTNNPIDTDEERQKFVADLMYYVDTYDLDGIDIDVEITNSDFWACFDLLVKDLSAELKPDGKLLTMAVATWFTDPIADSTYEYFDFINLMSYYGTGYDSHMNQIYNYLTYYGNRGVSDDRMVIGVPFYGNSSGANPTYGEIIAMSTDASMLNYYNGINYNGAHTITAKAEYSLDYGGIMIWEVGQDSFNKRYSLLEAIKRVNDTTGTATDIGYLANLNSSKTTCTSTKLSWTASENAVSYKIYNDNTLVGTTSGTSLEVSGLTETTEYYFTVNAVDASGNLIDTASILVTTLVDATGIPEWSATTIYKAGNRVVYQGKVYQAQWITRNYEPTNLGVWLYIGVADAEEPEISADVFVFKINDNNVLYANQNVKFPVDAPAQLIGGKTLVPLRAISSAVGIEDLVFDSETFEITFTGYDGYTVEMTVDSTVCTLTKNGVSQTISITAPVLIDGITMLPLRDATALVGGTVKFDDLGTTDTGYVVVSGGTFEDADVAGYIEAYEFA